MGAGAWGPWAGTAVPKSSSSASASGDAPLSALCPRLRLASTCRPVIPSRRAGAFLSWVPRGRGDAQRSGGLCRASPPLQDTSPGSLSLPSSLLSRGSVYSPLGLRSQHLPPTRAAGSFSSPASLAHIWGLWVAGAALGSWGLRATNSFRWAGALCRTPLQKVMGFGLLGFAGSLCQAQVTAPTLPQPSCFMQQLWRGEPHPVHLLSHLLGTTVVQAEVLGDGCATHTCDARAFVDGHPSKRF